MPKVLLKVTHTHAGVVYQPGSVIDVDSFTANWIVSRGLGEVFDESKQSVDSTENKRVANKKKRKG